MTARTALIVTVLMSAFVLLWVAMPTIRAGVPVWIIVDGLVAQMVLLGAISGAQR